MNVMVMIAEVVMMMGIDGDDGGGNNDGDGGGGDNAGDDGGGGGGDVGKHCSCTGNLSLLSDRLFLMLKYASAWRSWKRSRTR